MENKITEINQAIEAGQNVLRQTDIVLDYLGKAQTWGYIDMFSRGGLISGLLKHSKMNYADDAMQELKYAIDRFNKELNDVRVYDNIQSIDFDRFMRFLDIFCDNFIIDFIALSRISDSKQRIKDLSYEVKNIINKLETIK